MLFSKVTPAQWEKHPSFRSELKELINHPTFQTALGIVLDRGLSPKALPPGNSLLEWSALMGQRREGYIEALDNFMALTEPPSDKPASLTPWVTHQSAEKKPEQTS